MVQIFRHTYFSSPDVIGLASWDILDLKKLLIKIINIDLEKPNFQLTQSPKT